MKLIISILITMLTVGVKTVMGQLPVTNILLLDIDATTSNGDITPPKFLTAFNKQGYNNQPHFISKDELLFSSNFNAQGLTDIYHINLKGKTLRRITATDESEYSPLMWEDRKFTVVRQELSSQKQVPQVLWQYPLARDTKGKRLFVKYQNIGYYCWLPDEELALFLVGEPSKLVIVNTRTEKESFVTYNVGRSIKYDGDGGLVYVLKMGNAWTLKRYDLQQDMSQYLTSMLAEVEDFEIMPNGKIISGKGPILYIFDPEKKDGWKPYKDLSGYGIKNISRIASYQDKLAIVVTY